MITIGVVSPIAAAAVGVGIYWGFAKKKSETVVGQKHSQIEVTTSSNSIYDKVDIFPNINQYDFYQYIRIEDGKPVIDDNFIAKVINYVIKNTRVTDGDISMNYTQPDIQSLSVTFYWVKDGEKEYWKTYNFSLSV